jgi:signal transduction histidine kinase
MLGRVIGENIELSAVLEPELGRVKADPGQIEQVILNLALNARDAVPQGGQLTLETANVELNEGDTRTRVSVLPGRYVMLAASDSGIGMDAETQAHIFEPFFTTKEKGKGTGLRPISSEALHTGFADPQSSRGAGCATTSSGVALGQLHLGLA